MQRIPLDSVESNSQALRNYRAALAALQQRGEAALADFSRLYDHWPALRKAFDIKDAEELRRVFSARFSADYRAPAACASLGNLHLFCDSSDPGPMTDCAIASALLTYGLVSFPEGYTPIDGGAVSRGISSAGYDLTLAERVLVFKTLGERPEAIPVIDPANFDSNWLRELPVHTDPDTGWRFVMVPPGTTALGFSNEIFALPDNVIGQCLGKSTYARCGVDVMVTPLEPGWDGQVTLEFSNNTALAQRYYIDQGILQVCFTVLPKPAVLPYHAKGKGRTGGKYSNQRGVILPRNSEGT